MDNRKLKKDTLYDILDEMGKEEGIKALIKRRNDMADKKVAKEMIDEGKPIAKMKPPKKPQQKGRWVPICRTVVEDFDEDLGRYTGANHLAELQQNSASKVIRTVVISR